MLIVKETGGGSVREYIVRRHGPEESAGKGTNWTSAGIIAVAVAVAVPVAVAVAVFRTGDLPDAFGYANDFWIGFSSRPAILSFVLVGLFVAILGPWLAKRLQTVEESVLCVQGLGLQLRSRTGSGVESYRFYERAKITNVLINEGFVLFEPRYYLAFAVEGLDRLVLAFPELLPGLDDNLQVYHGCRALLFESGDGALPETAAASPRKRDEERRRDRIPSRLSESKVL